MVGGWDKEIEAGFAPKSLISSTHALYHLPLGRNSSTHGGRVWVVVGPGFDMVGTGIERSSGRVWG